MRILHAIHSANPKGGGPIEGVTQLGTRNVGYGHDVEILCLDKPDSPWIAGAPLKIHCVGPTHLGYGFTPRLEPWLEKHHRNYDVVVVNGIWQYNSYGVWRVLRNKLTPYCVFPHGMLDPWFKRRYPLKHLKKMLYWPWADYYVLRDALAVVFTSEEERRVSRQSFSRYRCDEWVMTYGTSPPRGDEEYQRRKFLEAHPSLANKKILLYLGRIHEKKGCDLLIRGFAASLQNLEKRGDLDLSNIHLVMAGPDDNPYAWQMKRLADNAGIASRITWTGMLSGDIKWGAYRCAHSFVLPSHQENFGIAVAEALACGVPVLISNRVNIWREIKMHDAGIIETDDLIGTTILLKKWMRTPPGDWDAMRRNAILCFKRCFDIERVAASFIDMLDTLGLPKSRMRSRKELNPT